MSEINVLIKVSREQQIELEDMCLSKGISLSEYFIKLHENSKIVESEKDIFYEPEEDDKENNEDEDDKENEREAKNEQPKPRRGRPKKIL